MMSTFVTGILFMVLINLIIFSLSHVCRAVEVYAIYLVGAISFGTATCITVIFPIPTMMAVVFVATIAAIIEPSSKRNLFIWEVSFNPYHLC